MFYRRTPSRIDPFLPLVALLLAASSAPAIDLPRKQVLIDTNFIEYAAVNDVGQVGALIRGQPGHTFAVNGNPVPLGTLAGATPSALTGIHAVSGSNKFLIEGRYATPAERDLVAIVDTAGVEVLGIKSGDARFGTYGNPRFGFNYGARLNPLPNGTENPFILVTVVGDPGQATPAPVIVTVLKESNTVGLHDLPTDYRPDHGGNFNPFPGAYGAYGSTANSGFGLLLPIARPVPQPGYPTDTLGIDIWFNAARNGQSPFVLQNVVERHGIRNPVQLTVRSAVSATQRITMSLDYVYESERINRALVLAAGQGTSSLGSRQVAGLFSTSVLPAPVGAAPLGDLNEDGTVTHDDLHEFGIPLLSNIPFLGKLFRADSNGDGRATVEDLIFITPYLVRDTMAEDPRPRLPDPAYRSPRFGYGVAVQGEPIPGCPDLTVGGFYFIRANNNGVGLIGINATGFTSQAVVLVNDTGIHCIARSGQSFGDGPIQSIYGATNINPAGEFALLTFLADGRYALYQFEGNPRQSSASLPWLREIR